MHVNGADAVTSGGPFVLEITLDHPTEAVWNALTRKVQVDKYYFVPIGSDVGGVGSEIWYGPADHKMIVGRVISVDAPRSLVHTFRFTDGPAGEETVVTYTLSGSSRSTRLRIHHTGYPVPSQGYSDISGGWPVIAERLKSMLGAGR